MKQVLSPIVLAASLAVPLSAQAGDLPNDARTKIEQYMNAAVKAEHFMGSILVARGDHVIIAKGYGMADLENQVPNTPDTEFRIGSVTKQFTAMAILMLQEEAKLNVHDLVCKYVPKCPKDWQPITIYELLTHTSGIPNYTEFKNFTEVMSQSMTPTQMVALFKNKPLDFKPGTKFSYSNSGYVLLGYILQRVSGESYEQFLQQHIFGPVGMKDSGYDESHPTSANHAKGYRYDGKYEPAPYVDMSTPFSAGALYSTVRDLYTWDRALAAGKLIPTSLQKQMFAPQVPVRAGGGKEPVHYGFGWFISKEFGHTEYSHEGGIPGFTSFNSWFPKQHVYIIVLDNMLSPQVATTANSLAAIVFGQKYEIPKPFKAISLPAKELEKFVGTYQMAPNVFLVITRTGDQLKAQMTGQPAFPIYPESKNHFFLKAVRSQIFFRTNAQGKVTGLAILQNGQTHPGKRVDAAKTTSKPKP
ncbi:MAG TPA: serine hydrolase [Rhodanobacteraceae bacterium]|nr:serine hydrolase [Rhodanobacteraceae bacterium]